MTAILVLFAAFAADEVQAPVFFAPNDELRQYLLEAMQNNPGLKARHLEWQAALQKVPQVKSLEDPMFSYTQFLQSDLTRLGVSLEQEFPWFGTLRARGDKALAEADAVLSRFYAARNEVIAQVKRAYFEYALLAESASIVKSEANTLTEMEELVKSRYGLGLASQADLYRVQIEKDKLDDSHKGLTQSRPALSARLREVLGREPGEELAWPQSADSPPPPPPAPVVLARIRATNPELSALEHLVASWEKEVVLAKKRGYPDFTIGIGYANMKNLDMNYWKTETVTAADAIKMFVQDAPVNGVGPTLGEIGYDVAKEHFMKDEGEAKDDISVSLRLSLPIWRSRVKAGIQEAKLMQDSAENDKRRTTLALDSAARMTLFGIEDAQRRLSLYRDVLIPKEKKAYESLQEYYGAGTEIIMEPEGTADFLDLQNSVRALLEFRLEQARAARDLQVASADLEMLMSGPWAASENQVEAEPAGEPAE